MTERLFIDSFVNDNVLYSDSWWFSKTNDGRMFWFIEKRDLSELDLTIVSLLKSKGQQCCQLVVKEKKMEEDNWKKEDWNIINVDTKRCWSVDEFVKEYNLKLIPKSSKIIDNSDYEIRQLTHCIEHYKKLNMLTDIERSISIEDLFLNQYFYTSNVDLFMGVKNDSAIVPICLEIKFKDEFKVNGMPCFGMDCYQLEEEYTILERAGMKIFNVILYNDKRNKERTTTTNIFDYMVHSKDLRWIYTRISRLIKYEKYCMRSTKTSFTGTQNKSRTVYCIPMEIYADLKDINQIIDNTELLDSLGNVFDFDNANKKRCPECDSQLLVKDGKYGKFVGCSNYPKCEYSRRRMDEI